MTALIMKYPVSREIVYISQPSPGRLALDEDYPLAPGVVAATTEALGVAPKISRWSFSTNGVATVGLYGIPTVGFAPSVEELTHATEERVTEDDIITATAVCFLIRAILVDRLLNRQERQEREDRK
jgi:hypothetical protein